MVGQGMLLMDSAALLGDPLEGEIRCLQHMLSPQVTFWGLNLLMLIINFGSDGLNHQEHFC